MKELILRAALLNNIGIIAPIKFYCTIENKEDEEFYNSIRSSETVLYEIKQEVLTDEDFTENGEIFTGLINNDFGININLPNLKLIEWQYDYTIQIKYNGKIYAASTEIELSGKMMSKCKLSSLELSKYAMPLSFRDDIDVLKKSVEKTGILIYSFMDEHIKVIHTFYNVFNEIYMITEEPGYKPSLKITALRRDDAKKIICEYLDRRFG